MGQDRAELLHLSVDFAIDLEEKRNPVSSRHTHGRNALRFISYIRASLIVVFVVLISSKSSRW